MADDSVTYKVVLDGDAAGGEAVKHSLKDVEASAKEAGQAIKENLGKVSGSVDTAELSKSMKEAGKAVETAIPSFNRIKEALSGLDLASKGPSTTLLGLSKTINSLSGGMSTVATSLAALGGAFAVGFKGGSIIDDVLVKPLQSAINTASEDMQLFSDFAKDRLLVIGDVDIKFDNIKAGLKEVGESIESTIKSIKDLEGKAAVQKQITGTDRQTQIDQFKIAEKKEIAGAGGDKTVEAAISAKYAAKIQQVEVQGKESDIQADLERKYKELEKALGDRTALQNKIGEAEEVYLTWLRRYNITGGDPLMTKGLVSAKSEYEALKKTPEKEKIDSTVSGLYDDINVLNAQGKGLGAQKEMAGLDSAGSLTTAINGLEKAIRDQELKVSGAKATLASAHVSGDMVSQGAAYDTVQKEESKLSALKDQLAAAKKQLDDGAKYFGDSVLEFGKKLEESSKATSDKIGEAGATATKKAEEAGKDIDGASKVFTEKVSGSTGSMVSSIDSMKNAVVGGLESSIRSIETLSASLESMKARMASAEATATRAAADSQLALSQIKNQR